METNEFVKRIEEVYAKYFPNSKVFISTKSSLYKSIYIKFCLAGDKSELSGGYWDNDMLSIKFEIDSDGRELPDNYQEKLPDKITLSAYLKSYHIKPDSRNMVYGRQKLSFRKSTGNPEKIISSLDKFLSRLRESVVENFENEKIHNNHVDLVEKKLKQNN